MAISIYVLFFLVVVPCIVSVKVSEEKPHYIRTPYGLAWSSCVHSVESGSHVYNDREIDQLRVKTPSGELFEFERCEKPIIPKRGRSTPGDAPDDGWQVWTAYNQPSNKTFDSFLGYFNVPNSPSSWDGEILYMFTGLQDNNWVPTPATPVDTMPYPFDIIQPVLQYDGSWELASWYVGADNVVNTGFFPVSSGDSIFGNMTRLSPTDWFIGGLTSAVNASFTVTDSTLVSQPWAYCTLEVYSIPDCNNFPPTNSPMEFTKLVLTSGGKVVTPTWVPMNNDADHCTAAAKVVSPTHVVITF